MGSVKVDPDGWFIRCSWVTLESGKQVARFYRDNTIRNVFERIIYESKKV